MYWLVSSESAFFSLKQTAFQRWRSSTIPEAFPDGLAFSLAVASLSLDVSHRLLGDLAQDTFYNQPVRQGAKTDLGHDTLPLNFFSA
jgi:hypothetical protein